MDMTLFNKLKGEKITPSRVGNLFINDTTRVENGYTKVVIISKMEDFVIKIPRGDSVTYTYCERECHVYEKAIKWGIEFLFAKTTRMGVIDKKEHRYFYKQEKIEQFGYRLNREIDLLKNPVIERYVEKAMKETDMERYGNCAKRWYAYVLKAYGYDTLIKLLLFLKIAKVNDLRSDNVGFRNGKPVLIDYSGFHGGHNNNY